MTGLTAAELAERQRTSVHRMEAVLVDSQKLGLVEVDPGGYWRLTDAASRRLGVAVSSLRYEHEPEGDTQ